MKLERLEEVLLPILIGLVVGMIAHRARADDWQQIPIGKTRYYACFPDNGSEAILQQDGDLCSPKKVKAGLKRSLRLSYTDAYKTHGWGSQKDALKQASESYKGYICKWVWVTVEVEQ